MNADLDYLNTEYARNKMIESYDREAKEMIIPFGKFRGQSMSILDDGYLQWLAKPKYSGKYYESLHSTDLKWKVPFTVKIEARRILESRGYTLIGEHWEK